MSRPSVTGAIARQNVLVPALRCSRCARRAPKQVPLEELIGCASGITVADAEKVQYWVCRDCFDSSKRWSAS